MERIPDSKAVAGRPDTTESAQFEGETSVDVCEASSDARPSSELPVEEEKHPHHRHHLGAKNTLALCAAAMFMLALFADDNHLLFKAIAYGLGALAYIGELLVLTSAFRRRAPLEELFMPLLFGLMYLMMGLSYALEHHYLG